MGQRLKQTHHQRKNASGKQADAKITLYHMLLGNCKLRQSDSSIHLLEWPKSKTLDTWNAGEDVEPSDHSFTVDECAKRLETTLEDSSALSYKPQHILTMQSNNHTPWYLPK
jgi:hypothetical protein